MIGGKCHNKHRQDRGRLGQTREATATPLTKLQERFNLLLRYINFSCRDYLMSFITPNSSKFLSHLSVCIYVAVYILQCFHVGQDKIDIRYVIYERSVSNLFVCPPSQLLVDREKMIDEHCTAQLYACISYWSVVMR